MRRVALSPLLVMLVIVGSAPASNQLAELGTVTFPCGGVASMEGARDAVLSPDEQHLYVIAAFDDAVTVFDHDPLTGALAFNHEYATSDPGLSAALLAPNEIVISPDGTSVYVISSLGRHVAAFARTPGTGALTFVNLIDDLDIGVDGLDQASDVLVSPDGAHVYVSAFKDAAVSIFERDVVTSALTFVGLVQQGAGGVTQLVGPAEMAMSPDGLFLYVAAQAGVSLMGELNVFARNPGTGALTLVETSGLKGPKTVILSPDGAHVYSSRFNGVDVFERDAGTGELTLVESQPVGSLGEGFEIAIDPTGSHLYYKEDATIEILERDAGTGELTPVGVVAQTSGSLDGLDGLAAFVFPSSGDFVHVVAAGDSSVTTFARDGGNGSLTPSGIQFDAGPPLAVAVAPDGNHAYVVCARSTGVLGRDAGTGALTPSGFVEHASIPGDSLAHVSGPRQTRVVVSPDDAHVYALRSQAVEDTLEAFDRDPVTGALTSIQTLDDATLGLFGAVDNGNGIALSPDGEHAYVSTAGTTVVILDRDPVTGVLSLVGTVAPPGVAPGRDVVVSPDGAHVYVLASQASNEGAVAIFDRDPVTGDLTPGPVLGGLPDLDVTGGLAVSSDGANLYAGGDLDAAIAVLRRDAVTGDLDVLDVVDDVQGLHRLRRIVVDPTGASIVTAGRTNDLSTTVLNAFRRDAESGALTLAAASSPTASPFGTLPLDLAISADARSVYLVDFASESVTVFGRTSACAPSPLGACATADKARLTIKDTGSDVKRVLAFKWKSASEPLLGDPLASSGQAFCLYDASAAPQPLIDALAPAAGTCGAQPCWRAAGTGVKYGDTDRTPDGLQRLKIVPKPGARSKVVLKAKGGTIPPFALPLGPGVVVQVQSTDASCIEATFATPTLNDGVKFTAAAP